MQWARTQAPRLARSWSTVGELFHGRQHCWDYEEKAGKQSKQKPISSKWQPNSNSSYQDSKYDVKIPKCVSLNILIHSPDTERITSWGLLKCKSKPEFTSHTLSARLLLLTPRLGCGLHVFGRAHLMRFSISLSPGGSGEWTMKRPCSCSLTADNTYSSSFSWVPHQDPTKFWVLLWETILGDDDESSKTWIRKFRNSGATFIFHSFIQSHALTSQGKARKITGSSRTGTEDFAVVLKAPFQLFI